MAKVKAVPDGFHTLTPHITVAGANDAIEFYKTAFGAEELARHATPDGKSLMHALLRIGDSMLMLNDEFPEWGSRGPNALGGTAVTLSLYVADAELVFERAVAAGASVKMPLSDTFWGDRYGIVTDPFGHSWSIGSHLRDVPPEEMQAAAQKAFSGR
jgi:PhnB protein